MKIELDHFFVFVEPGGEESAARLEALGLVPTYRRVHDGQGTANICYAFDNAYLELLWVEEPERLARATFARTGLFERSEWRTRGTSPFGVCVREERPLPFDCWLWRPTYLPPGMFFEVAANSANPRVPFLFAISGSRRPDHWPPAERGRLQRDAGFTTIDGLRLNALPEGEALPGLVEDPALGRQEAVLTLARGADETPLDLLLPACRWLA